MTFRDHLCAGDADRARCDRTKRELAARAWRYVQHGVGAESAVVAAIIARASESPSAGCGAWTVGV